MIEQPLTQVSPNHDPIFPWVIITPSIPHDEWHMTSTLLKVLANYCLALNQLRRSGNVSAQPQE